MCKIYYLALDREGRTGTKNNILFIKDVQLHVTDSSWAYYWIHWSITGSVWVHYWVYSGTLLVAFGHTIGVTGVHLGMLLSAFRYVIGCIVCYWHILGMLLSKFGYTVFVYLIGCMWVCYWLHLGRTLVPGELNWEVTKQLYRELLSVFDKLIFPTHASCHAQYLMFYICSFRKVGL